MRYLMTILLALLPLQARNALWVDISGTWRVSEDDDPRYASRDFNDSAWRTVTLPRFGGPNPRRSVWMRRHIDLPPGAGLSSLALTLGVIRARYEVFVNGQRIGATEGLEALSEARLAQPQTFPIPATAAGQSLQIALRTHFRPAGPFPWRLTDRGPYAITYAEHAPTGAARAQFDEQARRYTPFVATGAAMLGIALLSLLAWWSERSRREFLWFALYAATFAADDLILFTGIGPEAKPFSDAGTTPLHNLIDHLSWPFLSEFALATLGSRWRAGWRVLLWAAFAVSAVPTAMGYPDSTFYYGMILRSSVVAAIVLTNWGAPGRGWEDRMLPFAILLFSASTFEDFARRILAANPAQTYFLAGNYLVNRHSLLALALAGILLTLMLRRLMAHRREQQRLAAELEAAGVIQRLMLKDTALREPGLALDAVYAPALEAGGDFYYVLGGEMVVVGDVSGKGLKAAMLVSLLIGVLRNTAEREPARVLSALNSAIAGQSDGGFVTCCCGRFDPDGRVTIANAGHPSPYCDGREVAVEAGLPLGVVAGVEYEESIVRGERFTFVSDGVVEAENSRRELFGFDRTREISTQSAREIAEAAKAWGQNDDITVVTVRRNA